MRSIILIFLCLPICIFCQRDSVAVKDANRIIVVTGKPAKENFRAIISQLSEYSDVIHMPEDDSMTLRTNQLQGRSATVRYQIKAVAKENEIILSGDYSSSVDVSVSGTDYKVFLHEISNSGKKTSASKYLFQQIVDIAQTFNGSILYSKEKIKKKASRN